ncbi:hypothetical protein F2P81_014611 [Scophthalmus maximus]|uniref:Uncharacterized protein n=1 Tax=Scophthalmus maximus TaxID=52904 RepID=A0A6A4SMH6_SCOMX|nr:hypothetical protein F2P81_014611 [Scophthalmus maximus]
MNFAVSVSWCDLNTVDLRCVTLHCEFEDVISSDRLHRHVLFVKCDREAVTAPNNKADAGTLLPRSS